MPKHGRQILVEALKLPPVERAELIEGLLTSFEFQLFLILSTEGGIL